MKKILGKDRYMEEEKKNAAAEKKETAAVDETKDMKEPEDVKEIDDMAEERPIQKREPLPTWGITSLFIPITLLLTCVGVFLGHIKFFKGGIPTQSAFRYTYLGIGCVLAIVGLMLLLRSVSDSQLFMNLKLGKLITTGVYSWTRHPLYTGVLFICTGALFISGNAFFYVLPFVFYFLLNFFLKNFVEPLLYVRFGDDYINYVKNVNRIIPWKKHL